MFILLDAYIPKNKASKLLLYEHILGSLGRLLKRPNAVIGSNMGFLR